MDGQRDSHVAGLTLKVVHEMNRGCDALHTGRACLFDEEGLEPLKRRVGVAEEDVANAVGRGAAQSCRKTGEDPALPIAWVAADLAGQGIDRAHTGRIAGSNHVIDSIAVGIDAIGLPWLKPLVKLGALAGISSVVLVMLMAQTRIFMTMARDGLLPRWVGRLHPRYRTPHLSTLAIGVVVMAAAGVLTISDAGELVSIGTLFAFALVCVGVLILRVNHPEITRGFRVPFVWLFAPLGALMCVGLMAGLPYSTWVRLSLWTNLGLLIYASYGSRNSKVVQSWWSGKLGNDPERIDLPPLDEAGAVSADPAPPQS